MTPGRRDGVNELATPAPPDRLYEATAWDDDDLARCPRIHAGDQGGRERREHWQQAAWLLMEAAESGDLEGLAAQIELVLVIDGALALAK